MQTLLVQDTHVPPCMSVWVYVRMSSCIWLGLDQSLYVCVCVEPESNPSHVAQFDKHVIVWRHVFAASFSVIFSPYSRLVLNVVVYTIYILMHIRQRGMCYALHNAHACMRAPRLTTFYNRRIVACARELCLYIIPVWVISIQPMTRMAHAMNAHK